MRRSPGFADSLARAGREGGVGEPPEPAHAVLRVLRRSRLHRAADRARARHRLRGRRVHARLPRPRGAQPQRRPSGAVDLRRARGRRCSARSRRSCSRSARRPRSRASSTARAPSTARRDIGDSIVLVTAQLIGIPGTQAIGLASLALGLGWVVICLNAMRVGLLTRFMGVLGHHLRRADRAADPQPAADRADVLARRDGAAAGGPLAQRPAARLEHRARPSPWPSQQELREARRARRGARARARPGARDERRGRPRAPLVEQAQEAQEAQLAATRSSPRPSPSGACSASSWASAVAGALPRSASETTTIVANASGTEITAGWLSSSCSVVLPASHASPRKISPLDTSEPTTRPAAAPRAVSPSHQIPSSSSGQNVLAASANAQPTSREMSRPRASSASAIGGTIAPSAVTRKRRRRSLTAPAPPRQRSKDTVPASETSRPEAVDMKAANAPAATSAPSSSPPRPGQAASGRRRTTESVSPVR